MRKKDRFVDVLIPKKRNALGKRFRFTRFVGVTNMIELERRLNGVWWGSKRLKANVARFSRKKL